MCSMFVVWDERVQIIELLPNRFNRGWVVCSIFLDLKVFFADGAVLPSWKVSTPSSKKRNERTEKSRAILFLF